MKRFAFLILILRIPALLCFNGIKYPRYFEELPQSRIDKEIAFFAKYTRWSQRVIIELIAHNVLGGSLTEEQARGENSDTMGMFQHPGTNQFEYFNTNFTLGWKHDELDYISDLESICSLDGIICGDRDQEYIHWEKSVNINMDRYEKEEGTGTKAVVDVEETCWCITKLDTEMYTWSEDSDSDNKSCIALCASNGPAYTPKNTIPLDAITGIDFRGAGIVGSMIPFEVSQLFFLESIDIGENRFIGPLKLNAPNLKHLLVPDNDVIGLQLTNMKSLEILNLRHTGIGGAIPEGVFLPSLKYLNLSVNKIVGNIPSQFYQMSKLQTLELGQNLLTGSIPKELIQMESLKRLCLAENKFTSFPYEDWPSSNLREIDFHNNQLAGTLPTGIFQPLLEHLDLSDNKLKGSIPKEIKTSENLRYLGFAHNRITGTVPLELYKLYLLTTLHISGNKLQGHMMDSICEIEDVMPDYFKDIMPPCNNMVTCPRGYFHPLGHATEDEDCAVCPPCHSEDLKDKNCLVLGQTKCVDGSLVKNGDFNGDGVLSEREILRLMNLKMDGEDWGNEYDSWANINGYPDACSLPGIKCYHPNLWVSEIRLESVGLNAGEMGVGLLPEIGYLNHLQVLDLSKNNIMHIPSEIRHLQNLQHLFCSKCGLHTIHPAIWTLTNLEALDLSMNEFSNQDIPPDIGRLTKLKDLKILRSGLVSSIPSEMGFLTDLHNLDLYGNQLTGEVPDSLGKIASLYRVDIYNNNLHGSVDTFAKLPNLEILHAKSNLFSGTIPAFYSPKLTWLDLGDNSFVGAVPASLGQLPKLVDLHLGNNKLFEIPGSLCSNSNLINRGSPGNCDYILCPIGTFATGGFAFADTPCEPCPEGESTIFLGSTECSIHAYIEPFLSLVNGHAWDFDSLEVDDECQLDGVECDEEYRVRSIEFPLAKLEFDKKIFTGGSS